MNDDMNDREALADALTDLAATHGDATGTLVPIDAARDAIIAAGFRRHPEPVKPSREEAADAGMVAAAVNGADVTPDQMLHIVDAVLALFERPDAPR